jgi:hypothetical protein
MCRTPTTNVQLIGEAIMLKILSDGDSRHRVEDSAGTQIGWIAGRTIGMRGFVTEDDARDATVAAWRAFDTALRQQFAGWPRYAPKLDQLRTVHDGAYEWFSDGSVPVARLLRPQRRAYDQSFGIELVLPSFASEGVAIVAAHSVAMAVAPFRDPSIRDRYGCRHGVPSRPRASTEPQPDNQ